MNAMEKLSYSVYIDNYLIILIIIKITQKTARR